MKYIRRFSTALLLLILLITGEIEAFAMNTGFSTEELSEDQRNIFLKNIHLSMLADEPSKKAIECFDVNENGAIAIGCSASDNKTVCIYTSDGNFQYGYSFECSGSFGIEMDKNNLIIYFVRSDIAIAIDPTGEVESILKIQSTSENNSYWNDSVFSTIRKVGDTEYRLKNDMGILNIVASSYSQLIVVNSAGEETILYDVNSSQLTKIATVYVLAVGVFLIAVLAIAWQFIKLKRRI